MFWKCWVHLCIDFRARLLHSRRHAWGAARAQHSIGQVCSFCSWKCKSKCHNKEFHQDQQPWSKSIYIHSWCHMGQKTAHAGGLVYSEVIACKFQLYSLLRKWLYFSELAIFYMKIKHWNEHSCVVFFLLFFYTYCIQKQWFRNSLKGHWKYIIFNQSYNINNIIE